MEGGRVGSRGGGLRVSKPVRVNGDTITQCRE